MTIVIPMAGASSRFVNEGYNPKYMLELKPGYTMFRASIESFKEYFQYALFIFVTNSVDATMWVENQISQMKKESAEIKDYRIITLDGVTKGQAETVYLGLQKSLDYIFTHDHVILPNCGYYAKQNTSLVIFNIDTIRHNFSENYRHLLELQGISDLINTSDEPAFFDAVYDPMADPAKWSFGCELEPDLFHDTNIAHEIIRTAEKEKIGDWCSTGLYIFPNMTVYMHAYKKAIVSYKNIFENAEYNYYIAPLYNILIKYYKRKCFILPCDKDDVEFAGIPEDYEALKLKYNK